MHHIYELVDITDDDCYYTIGLWDNPQKIVDYCESFRDGPINSEMNPDGFPEKLEVRERPVNQASHADAVVHMHILHEQQWTEDMEDCFWTTKINLAE